nr:glucuronate isomerase [Nigerium massiliense]
MTVPLTLNPDRLFPAEQSTRAITRKLYQQVKDLPIISPHGHVPPAWIADDIPFSDPASLLLTPDHYVNRVMHGQGVDLADLGVPVGSEFSADQARNAWRIFCKNWKLYRGTPMKYWMEMELVEIFGVDVTPSEETADQIYDTIQSAIEKPEFKPRALMDRFDIKFMATTDDPCDDLAFHEKLANDASFKRQVRPTFRPDKYLEPAKEAWNGLMDKLAEVSGENTDTFDGWIKAMENRRAYFKDHGAISSDHSHADLGTEPLDKAEADRLYERARQGKITAEEGKALRQTFIFEQARMASEDGLVMTMHPAVYRDYDEATAERFGADVGSDAPTAVDVVHGLHAVLNAFGKNPNYRLVIFTMDETVYSRELGPLAGFYPSLYVGVPWWFIDAPDAIKRFRRAVTEYGTFYKTSGFIDDTRAFLSIPARHDMSRRLDCVHLSELVAEHRLTMEEAEELAHELVVDIPTHVFSIPA